MYYHQLIQIPQVYSNIFLSFGLVQ